ncbi:TatD family hydrolase [Methanobrevibacter filiformis]|uniref:Tat-linked quality control protein TatD n=1 Tax=Methanobrevibacter filiformis TaxID=55758 RepID=A0A166CE03_9EURY|nr:TatD family hydrolase [Methanobrevibacter filiformis]KZX13517.1 Tat-linked quality control protein TatD [Methanobrevibacter filiformis]
MYNLIDIGVNLMHKSFNKDREELVKIAEDNGVSSLILTGTTEKSSSEAMKYALKHDSKLYSTAGVHPHNARDCNENTIDNLRKIAKNKSVVAIGECGLDYNRDFSPRNKQKKWFERQVILSSELEMPLFLHERDAFDDFSSIIEKHENNIVNMVVHCFTGSKKALNKYLDLGAYIGITGWVCDERRGKDLAKIVNIIPEDKLMVETDAPFLIPRNMLKKPKNGRNEPKFLPHIMEVTAENMGKDPKELSAIVYKNTKSFFNI